MFAFPDEFVQRLSDVFVRKLPDDVMQRLLDAFLQRHTDDVARRYSSDFLLWLLCFFFPEVADALSQEEPKFFVPRRWDEDYTRPDVLKKRVEDSQKRVAAWQKSVEVAREGERTRREVREKCSHDPVPTARKLGWKN